MQGMHGNGSRSLFIRTVTVGLGISPSLLTLLTLSTSVTKRSWAMQIFQQLPPVGNLAPP